MLAFAAFVAAEPTEVDPSRATTSAANASAIATRPLISSSLTFDDWVRAEVREPNSK